MLASGGLVEVLSGGRNGCDRTRSRLWTMLEVISAGRTAPHRELHSECRALAGEMKATSTSVPGGTEVSARKSRSGFKSPWKTSRLFTERRKYDDD